MSLIPKYADFSFMTPEDNKEFTDLFNVIKFYNAQNLFTPEKQTFLFNQSLELDLIYSDIRMAHHSPSSLALRLEAIKELYSNDNYGCFVHQTLSPYFSCLHFHIIKKGLKKEELYNSTYSFLEIGSFLSQDIYISELINNISINNNYYLNYDYSLIKSY